jgi:CheY-like chemotaxis protein
MKESDVADGSQKHPRVLIVDDEEDVRTYVSLVLAQNGFEVECAGSVKAALDTMREHHPALACIDIMMPKESGISLYKQMRLSPDLCHIPVLFVSGAVQAGEFDFRELVPDTKVPPPDGYIEKPIIIDQFVATVARLTGDGKDAHAAR